MALKGTLKDFSLADILQLIGIQRKTGVLNLQSTEDLVSISFVQGTIVSAESAADRLEERVATVLMKWGHCTPDQLEEARKTQQQTLDRLWTVLLQQQAVSADEIRQALQLQVEKIIYPVFRWQDGEYSFIQETDIDFDREHLTPIHSETVLMEGVRMMDEWPLLERKIRSSELVLSRAPVEGQIVLIEDCEETEDAEGDKIRMSQEEFSIYDLVDGVRSVGEIQELSPTHDFNTASVLCNLLGLGLVTPSGDGRSTSRLTEESTRKRNAPRSLGTILLWLAAIVLLALIVPRLHHNPLNLLIRSLVDADRSARLSALRDISRLHQLERQLEAFRLEFDAYPTDLDALVAEGFTSAEGVNDAQGRPFAYRTRGELFTLSVHAGTLELPEEIPDAE